MTNEHCWTISQLTICLHHLAKRSVLDHDAHDFEENIGCCHGGVFRVGVICGLNGLEMNARRT